MLPIYVPVCSRLPVTASVISVRAAWRLIEPHVTGTVLASSLTAIDAELLVPHSLHIPQQLFSHVHAVSRAIDKPIARLARVRGAQLLSLHLPTVAGGGLARTSFAEFAHRKPAAALAEVAVWLRDPLLSFPQWLEVL